MVPEVWRSGWVPSCKLKACRFNFWSRGRFGLRSPVQKVDVCLSHHQFSPSLFPSFPLYLKQNNFFYLIKKKNETWWLLGSFIHLQEVKETGFITKALSPRRDAWPWLTYTIQLIMVSSWQLAKVMRLGAWSSSSHYSCIFGILCYMLTFSNNSIVRTTHT